MWFENTTVVANKILKMKTLELKTVLLLVLLGFYQVHGAWRIDVQKQMLSGINRRLSLRSVDQPDPDPAGFLGLQKGEGLQATDTITRANGYTKTKYKETYNGIEIEDESVVIEQDKSGKFTGDISGHLVEGIQEDLPNTTPNMSAYDALEIAVNHESDDLHNVSFNPDTNAKLVIYTEDTGEPSKVECFLVWEINYIVNSKISGPFYVIDANNGNIVEFWEGIDSISQNMFRRRSYKREANNEYDMESQNLAYDLEESEPDSDCIKNYTKVGGIGGNVKTGLTIYGMDFPLLLVRKINNICLLENEHVVVKDRDYTDDPLLSKSESITLAPPHQDESEAYRFDCDKGINDEENGAYSPLTDVYHFSNVVYNMYRKLFNIGPLKDKKIKAEVHVHMSNARWYGGYISLGDGGPLYYPYTSMDVVAHEIAHGFTEYHSGLYYVGESGAMNEAYSDMAGEAGEYFLGEVDWYHGKAITKNKTATRFLFDPTKDQRSIGHFKDYCPGINVHYSSGVFNRAFYILSNQPGWDLVKAFEVFTVANMLYWTPHSTFSAGACGAENAAEDLGYDVYQVTETFRSVGVEPCQTVPPGVLSMYNLGGKPGQNVTFLWTVEDGVHDVHINLSPRGRRVDVDLYIEFADYNLQSAEIGYSNENIYIQNPSPGPHHIIVHGRGYFLKVALSIFSNSYIIAENIDNNPVNNVPFQMSLEILEEHLSHGDSIALIVTNVKKSTNAIRNVYMRYGEEVYSPVTSSYDFDYAGQKINDDDRKLSALEVLICKPIVGTWYLAIWGTFTGVDIKLHSVHYPQKLQEPETLMQNLPVGTCL